MKPRDGRTTYLSTLFAKYGLEAHQIAKGCKVTREAARHWHSGRSFPVALQIPSVVKLLRKYEPTLTADALLARENAVDHSHDRKPGPRTGRGARKAG